MPPQFYLLRFLPADVQIELVTTRALARRSPERRLRPVPTGLERYYSTTALYYSTILTYSRGGKSS